MSGDMLQALTKFYKEKRIYSCEFVCQHGDLCKAAANDVITPEKKRITTKNLKAPPRHGRFTEAKSAYVGTEYEENKSGCRILFLSLDPGSSEDCEDDPCQRTPEAIRERVIEVLKRDVNSDSPEFPTWTHWYGTHLLAARILEAAGDPASDLCKEVCAMLDDPNADAKKRDEKLAQVTPYFAHANVVKCSICRLGNAQAPDQMYRNCESYLEGELPVLKPDIVVTQGRHAARALEEQFVHSAFDPYNHRLRYLTLNENKPKDVLWIQAFHPRNGVFRTEGGSKWGDFTAAARDFMSRKRHRGGTNAG